MQCSVLYLLALAFADDEFKSSKMKTSQAFRVDRVSEELQFVNLSGKIRFWIRQYFVVWSAQVALGYLLPNTYNTTLSQLI